MHIAISGDAFLLSKFLTEAITALEDFGSYSIQVDDEKGRTLTLDLEAAITAEDELEWEQK